MQITPLLKICNSKSLSDVTTQCVASLGDTITLYVYWTGVSHPVVSHTPLYVDSASVKARTELGSYWYPLVITMGSGGSGSDTILTVSGSSSSILESKYSVSIIVAYKPKVSIQTNLPSSYIFPLNQTTTVTYTITISSGAISEFSLKGADPKVSWASYEGYDSKISENRSSISLSFKYLTTAIGSASFKIPITLFYIVQDSLGNDHKDTVTLNLQMYIDAIEILTAKLKSEYAHLFYNKQQHIPQLSWISPDLTGKAAIRSYEAGTDCGKYQIKLETLDQQKYLFEGNDENCILTYSIVPHSVQIPIVTASGYTYTGNPIYPSIKDLDSNYVLVSGDTYGIQAKSYTVQLSLIDKRNCAWEGRGTDDLYTSYTISPRVLTYQKSSIILKTNFIDTPGKSNVDLISSITPPEHGKVSFRVPSISNSKVMLGQYLITIPNSTQTYAVEYQVESTDSNYYYDNSWNFLGSVTVSPDTNVTTVGDLRNVVSVYSGVSEQLFELPVIHNGTITKIQVNGTTYTSPPTDVWMPGTYTIKLTINPSSGYRYTDENPKTYSINIAKKEINRPTFSSASTFVYDKQSHKPEIPGSDLYTKSISAHTAVGNYTATCTLNPEYFVMYKWVGTTSDTISLSWKITPKYLPVPTLAESSFNYEAGVSHKPQFNDYDSSYINIPSYDAQIEPGTYEITDIALVDKSNTKWADRTNTNKTVRWQITDISLVAPTAQQGQIQYSDEPFFLDEEGIYQLCPYVTNGSVGEGYKILYKVTYSATTQENAQ